MERKDALVGKAVGLPAADTPEVAAPAREEGAAVDARQEVGTGGWPASVPAVAAEPVLEGMHPPRLGETLSFAGRELLRALDARSLSQKALAEALDVSPAYVSAVVRGKKAVSAPTVQKMSAALSLDPIEERALHRAAARDHGFRLDLPEDW